MTKSPTRGRPGAATHGIHRRGPGVRARKRFGQHFLERTWIERVISVIDPQPDQTFLEIGPGRGALTRPLAAQARAVLAYEIDRDLARALRSDLPANVTIIEGDFLEQTCHSPMSEIEAGSHSQGVTARGKPGPAAPGGGRHGLNSYTGWFAGDAEMEGDYFGYDGPCPPWNDERLHHYTFTVYALDTERAPVEGSFEAAELLEAMEGHVLDQASVMGTYALNPSVRAEATG